MSGGIYISTGEVSGEQHAARLATALLKRDPTLNLSGMGTEILSAAGVDVVVDATAIRVMGFLEVLTHLPAIYRAKHAALDHIARTRPDAVVLVDYPGFHLRLAGAIRKRFPDIKILYYIAPKAWAWNERRVKTLARTVDQLLCIFPFEETWFGERGVKTTYVGNPTVDALRDVPDGSAFRAELNVAEETPLVGIMPGSRPSECARLLPPLLDTARELRNNPPGDTTPAFTLALAPGMDVQMLNEIQPLPEWVMPVEGRTPELMRTSNLLLAKSGTTTLEAALLGTPMIVVYKASAVSAWIARRVIMLKHVSLPNILAGREIVPEFLQEQVTAATLAPHARELLSDNERAKTMRADMAELRATLGDIPTGQRTADAVLEAIRSE